MACPAATGLARHPIRRSPGLKRQRHPLNVTRSAPPRTASHALVLYRRLYLVVLGEGVGIEVFRRLVPAIEVRIAHEFR
jgi:hypothetical protein